MKFNIVQKRILITLLKKGEVRNLRYKLSNGPDIVKKAADILSDLGLIKGKDFFLENDAPRGGWTGKHIKLSEHIMIIVKIWIEMNGWKSIEELNGKNFRIEGLLTLKKILEPI